MRTQRGLTLKRVIDVIVAIVALLITAPIVAIAMLAIVANTGKSPIFRQRRIGQFGRVFTIYKLSTMRAGLTDLPTPTGDIHSGGPVVKVPNDPRVFAIGRFLRMTSIDELPNILNVIRGEMSIVGPRPMQAVEIEHCIAKYGELATQQRLLVKPGITCLWQISGRSNLHFDERMKLDVEYATSWTPVTDLEIIAGTIPAVIFSRGAF